MRGYSKTDHQQHASYDMYHITKCFKYQRNLDSIADYNVYLLWCFGTKIRILMHNECLSSKFSAEQFRMSIL